MTKSQEKNVMEVYKDYFDFFNDNLNDVFSDRAARIEYFNLVNIAKKYLKENDFKNAFYFKYHTELAALGMALVKTRVVSKWYALHD
jgi:hypothetical protein